ncbi:MAG TPA: hypothetical protein PKZ20_19900, partial [Rhodocyclaceae bacterium]|nr:hypothetical protein [Rhodocyclaceae bacterium]
SGLAFVVSGLVALPIAPAAFNMGPLRRRRPPSAQVRVQETKSPAFRRFHTPDERRSVVILPGNAWGDWMRCTSAAEAGALPWPTDADVLRASVDPR